MHKLMLIVFAAWSVASCSVLVLSNKRHCAEAEPLHVIELIDPFDDVRDSGAE